MRCQVVVIARVAVLLGAMMYPLPDVDLDAPVET